MSIQSIQTINFFQISTDLGEFKEVIRACHRLLEIKKKHVDIEVHCVIIHWTKIVYKLFFQTL